MFFWYIFSDFNQPTWNSERSLKASPTLQLHRTKNQLLEEKLKPLCVHVVVAVVYFTYVQLHESACKIVAVCFCDFLQGGICSALKSLLPATACTFFNCYPVMNFFSHEYQWGCPLSAAASRRQLIVDLFSFPITIVHTLCVCRPALFFFLPPKDLK